ncbi:docking protein homolog [Rhynchophorus ferrugineus]|uniref:docking protein homolog n=1 Tax=Rhynchophorus ferrugineus TaxID=354439 RepID=UPI003FCE0359
MEIDDPIYQGFLLLPPSGKILKKSWQKKYCLLYKSSKFGIARIEIFETETCTGQPKIVTLENVIKITPKLSNVFSILTKTAEYEFATVFEDQGDDIFNEWFKAVQSVAFPHEIAEISGIEENNDLYCSTDEGVFHVRLCPSEASKRCKLEVKDYILVITQRALQLRNDTDNKLLYSWPYCFIRKYGYKNGKFTFESGRKCASGEGIFYLEHPHEQDIYRCLASKMKSIKKMLDSESKSSLLDCGDVQFHAAIGMEARSRSPLLASPTTLSLRSNPSSFQDSNISPTASSYTPSTLESSSIGKAAPKKAPRKTVPQKNYCLGSVPVVTINKEHDYQDVQVPDVGVRKYDTVEQRKDAWRTMGVETPSHTEQLNDMEEYISWGRNNLTQSMNDMRLIDNDVRSNEKLPAPAVITEHSISSDDQYYDHLNFFGSSSRLNVSSGYKQVLPPPLPPSISTPSVNHYDEVQCMEPARSADDSHLGYGQIKKDHNTGALKEVVSMDSSNKSPQFKQLKKKIENVPHQFQNDKPYAIVSKPKRV